MVTKSGKAVKRSAQYKRLHPMTRAELSVYKYQMQLKKYVVDERGCWIWTGSFFRDGYGQLKRNGKNLKAHRVFYETYNGDIPLEFCVLHKCDTPACVNPDHLFTGTNIDNIKDRDRKNRTHKTHVDHLDQKINIRRLAREVGANESTLRGRLHRGWSLQNALSLPHHWRGKELSRRERGL